MHVNDGFFRHEGLKSLCFRHERACSMAAEGYAWASAELALVNVTTGPGGSPLEDVSSRLEDVSSRLEDISSRLEDMAPFLPRETFAENRLIPSDE